jgi:hypothetical protein
MKSKKSLKKQFLILISILIFILFYYKECFTLEVRIASIGTKITLEDVSFNRSTDLIAFLHIEKTSSSNFEHVIMNNLKYYYTLSDRSENACLLKSISNLSNSKYAKYYCPRDDSKIYNKKSLSIRNSWFLGRQTYGWAVHWKCNVHSDFAKFKYCTDYIKKENKFLQRIHFITLIREPIQRYVSEWKHVAKETREGIKLTFNSINVCNNEISMFDCIPNLNKKNLSLEDFIACKNNMAANRQTRLLAFYNETNKKSCGIFREENKLKLLENAKNVLFKKMSFFGLTEYDNLSRKLFEKTFKNSFKFEGVKKKSKLKTVKYIQSIEKDLLEEIKRLNDLDLELYKYAKRIFFERLDFYNISFINSSS